MQFSLSFRISAPDSRASLRSRLSGKRVIPTSRFLHASRKLSGKLPEFSPPSILQRSLMREGIFAVPSTLSPRRLSPEAFINHFLSSRNPSPPRDYLLCNESKVETSQGITFFRDLCRMECTKSRR